METRARKSKNEESFKWSGKENDIAETELTIRDLIWNGATSNVGGVKLPLSADVRQKVKVAVAEVLTKEDAKIRMLLTCLLRKHNADFSLTLKVRPKGLFVMIEEIQS